MRNNKSTQQHLENSTVIINRKQQQQQTQNTFTIRVTVTATINTLITLT